ncbi:MAG: pilus assembly protein TadG-related protein [Gemmatimonadetes bacterium]|nr:pilus assembly protein TadG-related protein [Gemmatimonadota bacterium]
MNQSPGYGAQTRRTPWRSATHPDEHGSVALIVVLGMAAFLGLLALGIDLGALFNARSEAQRAADAAALAGASAFLDTPPGQIQQTAVERAKQYASSNEIRNQPIDPADISVRVNLDSATVSVGVRRNGVPTWFARLVGIDSVDIGADATAWAGEAGAAQCVKPFALPDMWYEATQDLNHNRIWDPDEHWKYDPATGDRYAGYTGPGGSSDQTGYGSTWRNGDADSQGQTYNRDYGRRVTLKVTQPSDAYVPSFFLPWVLPPDQSQPACGSTTPGNGNGGGGGGGGGGNGGGASGGDTASANPGNGGGNAYGWLKWVDKRKGLGAGNGSGNGNGNPGAGNGSGNGTGGGSDSVAVGQDNGSGRGAAAYRRNICSCNASVVNLDTKYMIEPGNMVGPTYQGVQALIAQDPTAYWDDQTNSVVSKYGMQSPRIVTVALFDPGEITKPGRQYLRFNNFARIFIEAQASRKDPVTGRFMYYVKGVGQGPGHTTGSLVRVLQLIR